jgi:hypothetical protein
LRFSSNRLLLLLGEPLEKWGLALSHRTARIFRTFGERVPSVVGVGNYIELTTSGSPAGGIYAWSPLEGLVANGSTAVTALSRCTGINEKFGKKKEPWLFSFLRN